MQVRYFVAIVIVFSALLLPTVVSQGYNPSGDQVNQVATITVGSTVSTSQLQQTLINRTFKVKSTTGTKLPCETYSFAFNSTQGQYVSGNLTSDIPLDFYIVQDSTYQGWVKSGSCGNGTVAITSQLNTMSYTFYLAMPTGAWDIVLVNRSNTRDADGFIAAYLSSGSYTITKPLLSTLTTTTSSSFTNTATTPPGIPGFPVESIAVGILAGLVALLTLRRRRST